MIARLLCLLGLHRWGRSEWDHELWWYIRRCTRPRCRARSEKP